MASVILLLFGMLATTAHAADFKPTEALANNLPASAAALSASLMESGTGNDESTRRALHGLAIWLGGKGTEAQRMAFATAIEAAGERPGIGPDVKWFLTEQMRWARATVPTIRRPGGAIDRTLETADLAKLEADAQSATGFARTMVEAELFWAVAGRAQEGPEQRKAAAGWFRNFWKVSLTTTGSGQLRCQALSLIADLDPAGAPGVLRDGLLDEASDVSGCAEAIAIRMPGAPATKYWITLAGNRKEDADLRAVAIRILGRRADASALPVLRNALGDPAEEIRVAAIGALGAVAGTRAIPDLVAKLGVTGTGEAKAATDSLLGIGSPDAPAALASGFTSAKPAARSAILDILSARVATSQLPLVLRAADDPDPAVAASALAAVGVLGGTPELDGLVGRVTSATDDGRRDDAVKAFVAIVKRMSAREAAATLVLSKLPAASGATRAALLGLLPKVGGDAALAAARGDLKSPDPALREAAVRALADWPDAGPLSDLLATACDSPEADLRVLAVRGAIKLAGRSDEPAGRRAESLANAYGLCVSAADRRLALAALGKTGHPMALAVARFAGKDRELTGEALAAQARIARAIAAFRPGDAKAALDEVVAANPAEAVRKQAQDGLKELQACADYLTAWEISKPYGREGLEDDKLLDTPFDPETDARKAEWQPLTRDEEADEPYELDFKHVFDVDHKAAYIRTTLIVPNDGKYRLEVGSDDGVKVWLDGKIVHTNNTPRGVKCGEDKIPVKLSSGRHALMLKVANGEGGWGACVALKTTGGKSVPGATSEIDVP